MITVYKGHWIIFEDEITALTACGKIFPVDDIKIGYKEDLKCRQCIEEEDNETG
jgi:hypothetical protein